MKKTKVSTATCFFRHSCSESEMISLGIHIPIYSSVWYMVCLSVCGGGGGGGGGGVCVCVCVCESPTTCA